jgi:predicted nucleotidyltransferase
MNEKLKTILTELRRYLADLYGERLVEVVLFGSQARGDAVEGSDIDVLVVLKGEVRQFEEVARTSEFNAALCLKYDVLTRASLFPKTITGSRRCLCWKTPAAKGFGYDARAVGLN